MNITPLTQSHIPEAAALFAANFRRLRQAVPALPSRMEDPACSVEKLQVLLAHSTGIAAFSAGRMAGYLGWWLVEGFRDTQRKVGYVPIWGHGLADAGDGATLRALYAAAAEIWYAEGCHGHAATLLADDPLLHKFWFWNGFGAMIIDAVRPIDGDPAAIPSDLPQPQGFTLRKATPADAELVSVLEEEHWLHYGRPPVLMTANSPSTVEECKELLSDSANVVWIAFDGTEAMGYLRFESRSHGAAEIVQDPATTACTGAFVRPQYRGRRAAPALLKAALQGFAKQGFQRCSVDFESFNPEASAFWMKYFIPVCVSVMRVPEKAKE